MSRLPIRIRLTIAFAAVMAVLLAGTGLFLLLRLEAELDSSLDDGLRSRADEVSALLAGGARGLGGVPTTRLAEDDETLTQLIGPTGRVIVGSRRLGERSALPVDRLEAARREPLFVDVGPPRGLEDPMRLLARPAAAGRVLVVGASRDDRDEALGSLRTLLLTGGPVALLLASLAGYALAAAALRPVESMRRRAAQISRLGRGRRLPVPAARDEVGELGTTLNEMLARLERSVERERSFVASASHELRTPLALLRGELELALREGRSPDELRAAIASAAEESDRLIALAEDLLTLARSDEGTLELGAEALDAKELLEATARRFSHRVAGAGRALLVDGDDGLRLEGDRRRLEQALSNLVDNAIRHGDGAITLAAAAPATGGVELHVRDEGPGMPPELEGHAFERFSRGARARAGEGTGLGLAIVDAVARAHGGRASAAPSGAAGADIWIELPAADIDGSE